MLLYSLHMAINNVAGERVCHVLDILREFLSHNFVSTVQSSHNEYIGLIHRRRSDWNTGGTHGRTYYKSPTVEAKTHFPTL